MINYGIFLMPVHDPAKSPSQCYDEDLELAVRSEELGFSEFWEIVKETKQSKFSDIIKGRLYA